MTEAIDPTRCLEEPSAALNELSGNVIAAALEVHRTLGPGFPESVYEQALAVELGLRRLSFQRQPPIRVEYKGVVVGAGRLDLLVEDRLVVELKAVEAISPVHFARVVSYLRATRCRLGLLINFNVTQLRRGIRRVVLTDRGLGWDLE